MAFCGSEGAAQVVDVVAVEYGEEVAGCHRMLLVDVTLLLLLRRYLDVVWAVLETKGGVRLRASAGR